MHDLKHPGTPSENETLHQLSALVSGRLAPGDVPAGQWHGLIDLALDHGLGPMLLWSVKSSGMDSAPCDNWQTLLESARQSAAADMLYEDCLRTITRAFASARIPAIWLKGAALARTIYPQTALRPMGDLDVLVPHVQVEAALDVLRRLGYEFDDCSRTFRPDSPDRDEAYLLKTGTHHHYVLVGGRGGAIVLELHFGLPAYTRDWLLTGEKIAWFWEGTRKFCLDDGTICTGPSAEAHLLYLAGHNILQHGESQAYLMRDLDVHLLVTHDTVDWNRVIDLAVTLKWTFALARNLERAMDFFGTPVPDVVLKDLARQRAAHEDMSLVFSWQESGFRWEYTLDTLSRLSAGEKIRYFFQNVFPAPGYMRSRYEVTPERSIWPYYPFRWFDQSREIARSMGRRMGMAKGCKP